MKLITTEVTNVQTVGAISITKEVRVWLHKDGINIERYFYTTLPKELGAYADLYTESISLGYAPVEYKTFLDLIDTDTLSVTNYYKLYNAGMGLMYLKATAFNEEACVDLVADFQEHNNMLPYSDIDDTTEAMYEHFYNADTDVLTFELR